MSSWSTPGQALSGKKFGAAFALLLVQAEVASKLVLHAAI
jgi:hypothetical protein